MIIHCYACFFFFFHVASHVSHLYIVFSQRQTKNYKLNTVSNQGTVSRGNVVLCRELPSSAAIFGGH